MSKPTTIELIKQLRRLTEEQWVNSYAEWINKAADRLEEAESKSCGEDNGYEDCIAHILKFERDKAEQTIKGIAELIKNEDPSLLALNIKYLINRDKP